LAGFLLLHRAVPVGWSPPNPIPPLQSGTTCSPSKKKSTRFTRIRKSREDDTYAKGIALFRKAKRETSALEAALLIPLTCFPNYLISVGVRSLNWKSKHERDWDRHQVHRKKRMPNQLPMKKKKPGQKVPLKQRKINDFLVLRPSDVTDTGGKVEQKRCTKESTSVGRAVRSETRRNKRPRPCDEDELETESQTMPPGDATRHAAGDPPSGVSTWACTACTFQNTFAVCRCTVCGKPRPRKRPRLCPS